jgi:hypothetical protein
MLKVNANLALLEKSVIGLKLESPEPKNDPRLRLRYPNVFDTCLVKIIEYP